MLEYKCDVWGIGQHIENIKNEETLRKALRNISYCFRTLFGFFGFEIDKHNCTMIAQMLFLSDLAKTAVE